MNMKCKGLLLLMLSLAACDRPVTPAPTEAEKPTAIATEAATQTPQQFWSEFRAAAIAADSAALQKLARFPFVTRGATDDDPSISHDEAAFAELLPKILAQDTGLSKEGETVRQYLDSHPELPAIATGAGQSVPMGADATQFVAGPLSFEKIGNRWLWVSAYLED
jgi:hypothetical protein